MSLWHDDPAAATFENIKAFCELKHPEGIRLDYKGDWPNDLDRLVCAFANTLGGLILIGVAGEKVNNYPVWPPQGFPAPQRGGVSERIIQVCRDNIYPPVRPQISPVIDNPHAPGTAVVVIRVDESPEAPHSVKGQVYERTGNQNFPYKPADIGRIEALIRRRGKVEDEREASLAREILRARRKLAYSRLAMPDVSDLNEVTAMSAAKGPHGRPLLPLRWISVIPLFPRDELCELALCYGLLRGFCGAEQVQRAPGGAFGVDVRNTAGRAQFLVGCSSLTSRGHVFSTELTTETVDEIGATAALGGKTRDLLIGLDQTHYFVHRTLRDASTFYQHTGVERPGFLQLSLGLIDVFGHRMMKRGRQGSGRPFVDDAFRADVTVPVESFLEDCEGQGKRLLSDLAVSFDAV
jgi:hypothetical protein